MFHSRIHYIRGQLITSPPLGDRDTRPEVVRRARIFRKGLDKGTHTMSDLGRHINDCPELLRPALLEALHHLGITPLIP